MKTIAVMTTTDSLEEAKRIAHVLVERRLAACAQVSPIESVYVWQGEVQEATEYRLFIKTRDDRYAEVESAICELHSYDLPAVYSIDLSHVYPPYADWVAGLSSTAD